MFIEHTTYIIYNYYISLWFHRRNKYQTVRNRHQKQISFQKIPAFYKTSDKLEFMELGTYPVIYNYSYNTDKQKKE